MASSQMPSSASILVHVSRVHFPTSAFPPRRDRRSGHIAVIEVLATLHRVFIMRVQAQDVFNSDNPAATSTNKGERTRYFVKTIDNQRSLMAGQREDHTTETDPFVAFGGGSFDIERRRGGLQGACSKYPLWTNHWLALPKGEPALVCESLMICEG